MTQQNSNDNLTAQDPVESQPLAQIEPEKIKVAVDSSAPNTEGQEEASDAIDPNERSLISAVRFILREHGIRKSAAAIRDAVDMPHQVFSLKQAVNALLGLGFKASFGKMSVSQLIPNYFPAIAIMKTGEAVVLKEASEPELISVIYPSERNRVETVEKSEFRKNYSGYLILSKQQSQREREENEGHWFFSAFRKSKWLYTQVLIAALISNFLSLSVTIFTITVYDRVIPNSAIDSLIALSIGVIIAVCFDFIIKGLRARFIDIASKRADLEISRRLFDRMLNLSPSEQRQKTGALASTIREFESLREFFNSSTLVLLIDLPFALFFIYVIYLFAGPLAYVQMIAVPVVAIIGLGIQPLLANVTKNSVSSGMSKQAVLVETLNGLETINATGSGKLMRKRYEESLTEQADQGAAIRSLSTLLVNFASSVTQFAQVATIVFGVYLILEGSVSQGALIGAMILGGRTMQPLAQMASALSKLNGARTAYANLDKLLGGKHLNSNNVAPISRSHFAGEIEFKNVAYSYEGADRPVIKDLSFKIPAGQKVAILGKMGSGKSTISRLVAGIIEPTQGAVLIDGVDVRQIDKSDLRKNVGIMLQESWLFSGTLRENIQMSYNEYDDEHILKVSKISGVDDFASANPKGYELMIREKGLGLSGGQKQAINLARSLLHDPQILLLDEPTSSMDQTTEQQVVQSLRDNCTEKTMLIVTHRNPILTMVDRVLIIENGAVIADQTPQQLGLKKA